MVKRLQCPCGELLIGEDDDDIVAKAEAHLAERHPDLAGEYTRDHILFMAF